MPAATLQPSDYIAPCGGGPAILHLRRGVYLAEQAEERDGLIRYRGRRRERELLGDRLYAPHTRSVRLAPGEWVEWLGADQGQMAA